MSTSKKIEINPVLFSINGSNRKTKRNKENINVKPLISPNVLKNKLLKRIREHKLKETSNSEGKISNNIHNGGSKPIDDTQSFNSTIDIIKYTDEFNDSLEYLQMLSKNKKQNEIKEHKNKTLKTYHNGLEQIPINLELPENLTEQIITVNTEANNTEPIYYNLNYKLDNNVPYGVLKGGLKPTYKEWSKTQKNIVNYNSSIINNSNNNLTNQNNNLSEKEKKLQLLREKFKLNNTYNKNTNNIDKISNFQLIKQNELNINNKPLINPEINQKIQTNDVTFDEPSHIISKQYTNVIHEKNIPKIETEISLNKNDLYSTNTQIYNDNGITPQNNNIITVTDKTESTNNIMFKSDYTENKDTNLNPDKEILKRIIKKKYILGKKKKTKTVSVLIKNKEIKKKIIDAHKTIKQLPINLIKKTLRKKNLIKIGSTAPNDVIRKIYEMSTLAGDIYNINKDTAIHNFIKDSSEI